MTRTATPTELRVAKDRRSMSVSFGEDHRFIYPAELLRVLSPSAEVQGHSPEQRVTMSGKRNVEILDLKPVGNYAVRIVFDDMHDTGIFSWDYFWTLGNEQETLWAGYLAELEEKGLSREPTGRS